MRILFINTLYTPNLIGGAERSVQFLAEGVVKAGHQAVVVSVAPQKGLQSAQINGVKVYYARLRNFYWPFQDTGPPRALKPLWHALDTANPWMLHEVARIIEAEQPDIVHTNTIAGFSPLIWQLVKQRGLPLVHTLRDYYLLCPRGYMVSNGENCRRICVRCRPYALPRKHLANKVDSVVSISRFVLDRHIKLGCFVTTPEKKVIHNPYQVKSSIQSLDIHSLPVRFGYLGQLHPIKGLEMLLEAVMQLPKGAWSLDIAGRGLTTYERYLHTRYKAPTIKFSGYLKPEVFFSGIDVLVVPSTWDEPFGRVIIEAYAHGVPVIASNKGGMAEIIAEGSTGFLFDPDRLDHLVSNMRQYINNPCVIRDMRSACLEKATDFLPESITEQYLKVYEGVIHSGARKD